MASISASEIAYAKPGIGVHNPVAAEPASWSNSAVPARAQGSHAVEEKPKLLEVHPGAWEIGEGLLGTGVGWHDIANSAQPPTLLRVASARLDQRQRAASAGIEIPGMLREVHP